MAYARLWKNSMSLNLMPNWDVEDQIKEMSSFLRGLENNVGFNILKLTK
jgi:hypothetical protein